MTYDYTQDKSIATQLREMKTKHSQRGLSVVWHYRPFNRKARIEDTTNELVPYFRDKARNEDTDNILIDHQDFEVLLGWNVPHICCSWFGSSYKVDEIKNFKCNIMYFDIDVGLTEDNSNYVEVEKNLSKHFHIVQRSNSWGKPDAKQDNKIAYKYHCYLYLAGSINDLNEWKMVYKQYLNEFTETLGFTFDKSITATKLCFAGQLEGFQRNRKLPFKPIPDVETFEEKNNQLQIKHLKRNGATVNVTRLKECFIQLMNKGVIDGDGTGTYTEWLSILRSIVYLVKEEVLTEGEALDVLELCPRKSLESHFRDHLKRDFKATFKSFNYHCRENDIDYSGVFDAEYEHELIEDDWDEIVTFSEEYLGKNETVNKTFNDVFIHYKGQRILIQSPTGAGKSHQTINSIRWYIKNHQGKAFLIVPRLLLAENLEKDFVFDVQEVKSTKTTKAVKSMKGIKATGYDLQKGKVNTYQVNESQGVLTTYDSLGKFENFIIHHQMRYGRVVIAIDEVHMLYSDAGFKASTVNRFWTCINLLQRFGVTIVGITATPEFMPLDTWDFKFKFERETKSKPFIAGEVYQSDEPDQTTINLLMNASVDKPVLAFIEHKETIEKYKNILEKSGHKVITISAEDKGKFTPEQDLLVNKGVVDEDVSVILATSVIGAGVSIVMTHLLWTTLILAGGSSDNTDPVSCIQYINRLREEYHKLIIVTGVDSDDIDVKKEFPIKYLYEKELNEMTSVVNAMNGLVDTGQDYLTSSLEEESGLFYDNGYKVSEFQLKANLLKSRKVFNKKYPKFLIDYLERYYDCKFERKNIQTLQTHDLSSEDSVSKLEKQEVLHNFFTDVSLFEKVREYRHNAEEYQSIRNCLSKDKARDLHWCFDNEFSIEQTKQVIENKKSLTKLIRIVEDYSRGDFTGVVLENMKIDHLIGKEFLQVGDIVSLLQKSAMRVCQSMGRPSGVFQKGGIKKYFEIESDTTSVRNPETKKIDKVRRYKLLERITVENIERDFGFNPFSE